MQCLKLIRGFYKGCSGFPRPHSTQNYLKYNKCILTCHISKYINLERIWGGGKEQVFFLQGTHSPIGAMNTKTNYSSVIIVTSSRIICGAQKGNDVK